jgi:hypothetical protein
MRERKTFLQKFDQYGLHSFFLTHCQWIVLRIYTQFSSVSVLRSFWSSMACLESHRRLDHLLSYLPTSLLLFRFDVLTAATMKRTIFWDATPVEVHRRFGGMYFLHLQARRVSQAKQDADTKRGELYRTTQPHIPEDRILHLFCLYCLISSILSM